MASLPQTAPQPLDLPPPIDETPFPWFNPYPPSLDGMASEITQTQPAWRELEGGDTLLASQVGSNRQLSPEQRLCFALLENAIESLRMSYVTHTKSWNGHKRKHVAGYQFAIRGEVLSWLAGDPCIHPDAYGRDKRHEGCELCMGSSSASANGAGKRRKQDAGQGHGFSFERVCEVLGVDEERIRLAVAALCRRLASPS